MFLFVPRSLCALKRIAARAEHSRFGATTGIRIAIRSGIFRAEALDGRRLIITQGQIEDRHPWPAFKETPDDAFEVVVSPNDLDRASKLGGQLLKNECHGIGLATVGNDVYLGLGNDLITTRPVEGRFPKVEQLIPKKRPLFSFAVDPKLLAETLLAMAEMLSDDNRRVQFFYYGDSIPVGICAKDAGTGMMIEALVVPLVKEEEPKTKTKAENPPQPAEKPQEDAIESNQPSPVATQWRELKERHPGTLLLFRVGDFYELFDQDAEVAAKELGLTLTTRGDLPMAGFPHHSLETYLHKLLQAGHRVAVCDQVGDGTTTKREVTRIVTPGSAEDGQPTPSEHKTSFRIELEDPEHSGTWVDCSEGPWATQEEAEAFAADMAKGEHPCDKGRYRIVSDDPQPTSNGQTKKRKKKARR